MSTKAQEIQTLIAGWKAYFVEHNFDLVAQIECMADEVDFGPSSPVEHHTEAATILFNELIEESKKH